jgi:hypothetical protein
METIVSTPLNLGPEPVSLSELDLNVSFAYSMTGQFPTLSTRLSRPTLEAGYF